MKRKNNHSPDRLDEIERVRQLVQSGHAGYLPRSGIVDRREFPGAISMPFAGKRAYSPRKGKPRPDYST